MLRCDSNQDPSTARPLWRTIGRCLKDFCDFTNPQATRFRIAWQLIKSITRNLFRWMFLLFLSFRLPSLPSLSPLFLPPRSCPSRPAKGFGERCYLPREDDICGYQTRSLGPKYTKMRHTKLSTDATSLPLTDVFSASRFCSFVLAHNTRRPRGAAASLKLSRGGAAARLVEGVGWCQ